MLLLLIFEKFTYLNEIFKDIKNEIARWTRVNYFENVLLVLTIPADYSEKDKYIMRKCTHNAKLIKNKSSQKLQFITECKFQEKKINHQIKFTFF